MNKKIVADIKHTLQYSQILIEMMKGKGVNRNNIPIEFIDDALRASRKIVRLLNKIAD